MYSIAILCHWTTGKEVAKQWDYRFNDPRFQIIFWDLLDDDIKIKYPPDYWIIINAPILFEPLLHPLNPSKTIVFEMEPIRFWKEINHYSFLKIFSHENDYNNIEWHLDLTMKDINKPIIKDETKSERISAILSSKYFDPGHIKRIQFVKYLETYQDIYIDVYGENAFDYRFYYGKLPSANKNKGMFPYKYHFTAENHSKKNYFTEKIVDAILSECICFYWGCPNISDYIDSNAYIVLDLNNMEDSLNIIRKTIQNKEWEKRIHIIKKEKQKLMLEMNMLNRLNKMFNSFEHS